MGVCESKNRVIPDKIENVPKIKTEDLPISEIKYFEYECPINIYDLEKHLNSIRQNTNNQNKNKNKNNHNDINNNQQYHINLKLTLSNIKINQCFSRDKSNKKSLFICELKLGKKIFPLFFNYGEYPLIYGIFEEERIGLMTLIKII